ncbi:acyl-CoA thioesterase [Basidiobolus ranarum]|uniref:Acyl-CoA thioesterase n=1 Tax=Basidiobolus ranarum TaxID=34480 RepID=A0ABR2WLX0_9FUNG
MSGLPPNSQTPQLNTLIENTLDLEEIDTNLYRSKNLWIPVGARGVFGGQVVAQALAAAMKTVSKEYHVHSLHSYFLLAATNAIPILYEVERVRDGKSYVTRTVFAKQKGRCIFTCTCSFQRPESSLLNHQYEMPIAPDPETLPSNDERYSAWLRRTDVPDGYKRYISEVLEEPIPVDIRRTQGLNPEDILYPEKTDPYQLIWMKAKGKLGEDLAFHQCVAAYCSDHHFVQTTLLCHGVNEFSDPRLEMLVSLDHTIWFHAPFRADEWLLYEMECPQTGGGRGLVFGRVYTADGKLVMSIAQEGLIRAGANPKKSKI